MKRDKYVDIEAMRTGMTLQKGYIDAGDQANTHRIQQLETTSQTQGEDIESLKKSVDTLEMGASFFVAAYAKGTTDCTPLFSKGNKEILKKFDFFLLDTSDNAGEVTKPVGKLMKNNLLHFANGGFAPVVGITQAMHDECTTNAIYTESDDGSYTESYAEGAYNPNAQWEIDKALIAEGQEPTTLYKKVGEEYQPVSHVLRPWETTETKYTIGIAPAQDLYILDNQVGASGNYWKGIFTEPVIWDGIDLHKFKLARTAIGPCPMTTVEENGVTKCRNFFYLYEAANANCKSNPGLIPNNPFYNKDRHYPRVTDVNQITNMNWARNNNADTTKSFPFAEGGWWATNAHIIALELLAETRYLHQANLFGSGISSNERTNVTNFYTSGGVHLKLSDGTYEDYRTFLRYSTPYEYQLNDTAIITDLLTSKTPIEACMESQLAASMATELGIPPTETIDDIKPFYFYGDIYYYMNVPGFAGLQDGDMNVRVYKVQFADVEGFYNGKKALFTMDLVYRMSLFNGVNLSGDIFAYNGGGLEHIGKSEKRTSDYWWDYPISVYLQPDQRKWTRESDVYKNISTGELWDFEKTYIKIGEYRTLRTRYSLERMGNAPDSLKNTDSRLYGETYGSYTENYWFKKGYRCRIGNVFRGRAGTGDGTAPDPDGACSPRYLNMGYLINEVANSFGGTFQALIDSSYD